jgi:hypothetical protein
MMRNNEVTRALHGPGKDASAWSETVCLRGVFDEVEAALDANVHREVMLTTLRKCGFRMTMASFRTSLQCLRKEKRRRR